MTVGSRKEWKERLLVVSFNVLLLFCPSPSRFSDSKTTQCHPTKQRAQTAALRGCKDKTENGSYRGLPVNDCPATETSVLRPQSRSSVLALGPTLGPSAAFYGRPNLPILQGAHRHRREGAATTSKNWQDRQGTRVDEQHKSEKREEGYVVLIRIGRAEES